MTTAHYTLKARDKISLLEQRPANFLCIRPDIYHLALRITRSLAQLLDSSTVTQKQQWTNEQSCVPITLHLQILKFIFM